MKNLILLFITGLLGACTSVPNAYVDYDYGHTFSDYKTFSWAHSSALISEGEIRLNETLENAANQAIKASMAAKGFTFVANRPNADFLVAYTVGARKNIKIYQTDTCVYSNKETWMWGKQYHPYYFDMVLNESYTRGFNKSVVALDVFDARSKVPIWHSKISKTANDEDQEYLFSNPEKLAETVTKLIAKFPPR
ncbi:MAG: DUF4136 domain-containing protein [Arenicella sp.]|nr:DUF4136 domain-containing protein [Arenicella sp.]